MEHTLQLPMPTKATHCCLQKQSSVYPTIKQTALCIVSSTQLAAHKNVTLIAPKSICSHALAHLLEQRRACAPLLEELLEQHRAECLRERFCELLLSGGPSIGMFPRYDLAQCFACGDADSPANACFQLLRRSRRKNHWQEGKSCGYVQDTKAHELIPRYEVIASELLPLNFSDTTDKIGVEVTHCARRHSPHREVSEDESGSQEHHTP